MNASAITRFTGRYEFLSNFHLCDLGYAPPGFKHRIWRSAEHAYQASKATTADDVRLVWEERYPGRAKALGRQIPCRPDWDRIKLFVMRDVLRAKFRNPELAEKLVQTGTAELVEGNHWKDTYWGQCPVGTGLNHLGMLLMEVREELAATRRATWRKNRQY